MIFQIFFCLKVNMFVMCIKNLCLKKNLYNDFHDMIIQLQRNNVHINLLNNEFDKQI